MPCYHPLKGFPHGLTKNGKPNYIITSYDVKHLEIKGDSIFKVIHDGIISPNCDKAITDFIEIPCGRCIGCRLDYARNWADRCLMEASQYEYNCFVTLTYDDDHLPMSNFIDNDTGEQRFNPTLVKRDLQLFMKRLRKKFGPDIRFFACGEYGPQTLRPHYHLILFNFDFDDRVYYKRTRHGFHLDTSEQLCKLWTNGFSSVGDCSWDTCNYVARYITKKQYGEDADYDDRNVVPPFLTMSRRPGIARDFYDLNKEQLYRYEKYYLSSPEGSLAIRPPRYFDKIYEKENPTEFEARRSRRMSAAKDAAKIKREQTSVNKYDQFSVAESKKLNQIKVLSRKEL